MNTQKEVHHHDGVLFTKVEAETGITYVAVDPSEVDSLDRKLLVRHGDHTTGNCGYYPVWLLTAGPARRQHVAWKLAKRPPQEIWVAKAVMALRDAGANFLFH